MNVNSIPNREVVWIDNECYSNKLNDNKKIDNDVDAKIDNELHYIEDRVLVTPYYELINQHLLALANIKDLYNIEKLVMISKSIFHIRESFCKQNWKEFANYTEIGENLIKSIKSGSSSDKDTKYHGLLDVYLIELNNSKWQIKHNNILESIKLIINTLPASVMIEQVPETWNELHASKIQLYTKNIEIAANYLTDLAGNSNKFCQFEAYYALSKLFINIQSSIIAKGLFNYLTLTYLI